MAENKEDREVRYMGHWRTCTECGWSGFEGDCDFGHNDFYCPKCRREALKLEKIGFMKVIARGYKGSNAMEEKAIIRINELRELQESYRNILKTNYGFSTVFLDYQRGRRDAFRFVVEDLEIIITAMVNCWLVTPSIGVRR